MGSGWRVPSCEFFYTHTKTKILHVRVTYFLKPSSRVVVVVVVYLVLACLEKKNGFDNTTTTQLLRVRLLQTLRPHPQIDLPLHLPARPTHDGRSVARRPGVRAHIAHLLRCVHLPRHDVRGHYSGDSILGDPSRADGFSERPHRDGLAVRVVPVHLLERQVETVRRPEEHVAVAGPARLFSLDGRGGYDGYFHLTACVLIMKIGWYGVHCSLIMRCRIRRRCMLFSARSSCFRARFWGTWVIIWG